MKPENVPKPYGGNTSRTFPTLVPPGERENFCLSPGRERKLYHSPLVEDRENLSFSPGGEGSKDIHIPWGRGK